MKQGIPINPEILKWARETAGYSLEQESKKYSKLPEWEKGESYPTYSQLQALAKHYSRPIAIFLFPELPKEETIEKSLRAVSEEDLHNLSPRVRYLFRKAKAFQIYLKELFADEYQTQLNKITWLKNHENKPINKLANDIRLSLNIPLDRQKKWKDADEAVEEWRNILADNGVYVFKEAFKDNKISGFCIYDDIFPVIFLNNSLSKNRQIFTIFHELAHLILQQNYLDVFDENFWKLERKDPTHIEVKCNSFAANFLVPNDNFLHQLSSNSVNDNEIQKLARYYKVSNEVILRKLLILNIVSKDFYENKLTEWKNFFQIKNEEKNNEKKKGGGQYNYTQLAYLGTPYFSLVLEKYHQGKINVERASEYLGINAKSFSGLEEAFLKRGVSNVHI